jgi:hypothetical protein
MSFHRCSIKNGEAEETSSYSSQGCPISLQGCGRSVASATGPLNNNKKVCGVAYDHKPILYLRKVVM